MYFSVNPDVVLDTTLQTFMKKKKKIIIGILMSYIVVFLSLFFHFNHC